MCCGILVTAKRDKIILNTLNIVIISLINPLKPLERKEITYDKLTI